MKFKISYMVHICGLHYVSDIAGLEKIKEQEIFQENLGS